MQPTLPWILAALTAALILGAAMAWRLNRRASRHSGLPSAWALSARPVFSSDERQAYRQLRDALPEHIVLAKLPLVRLCQPVDPQEVRYWYDLLGNTHVSFAICNANGRVLAAVDLDNGRNTSRRNTQIKQSVLAACRVRYLRCPADHLPSAPELQLLVPQAATAHGLKSTAANQGMREPETTTLWQESASLQDSFFGVSGSFGGYRPGAAMAGMDDIGGVVIETPGAPQSPGSSLRH
jgi:Protein of unknown function (DUF2726)